MSKFSKTIIILFIMIFSALSAVGIALWRSDVFSNSFSAELPFEYPLFSASDGNGYVYIIDSSQRRILKTSMDGKILLLVEGGKKEKNSFYNASELCPLSDGSFYIINVIPDSGGFFTESEEIQKYSADGKFQKTVFRREYSSGEKKSYLVQRGSLQKLSGDSNAIRWYEVDEEGIIEYYSSGTSQISSNRIFSMKSAAAYISFVSGDNSSLFCSTKRGEIYKINSGRKETVYSYSGETDKTFVPWDISVFNKKIYFTDIANAGIYVFDGEKTENIFSPEDIVAFDNISAGFPFYRFSISSKGEIFTCRDNSVIGLIDGKVAYNREAGSRSFYAIFTLILLQIILVISVLLFLSSIIYFYINIMKRKISLIVKQLVFVPLIVFSIAMASLFIYRNMSSRHEDLLKSKIAYMVQQMAHSINPDDIENVKSVSDYMNNGYKSIRQDLHSALNNNSDSWNYGFYFALHGIENGNISSMMFLNDGITAFHPFSYLNDPEGIYKRAEKGSVEIEKSTDAWGTWFYGVGPVYSKTGKVIALLEVGKDNLSYETENRNLFKKMVAYVGAISVLMILLFGLLTYVILSSVRNLSRGAGRISEGHWDVEILPKSNDEIADLTHAFNRMAKYVRNYISEITQLNKAYHGFVPMEFLKFLKKESIIDVRRGDQTQQEMTVMFTDIRSFTDISESMSPKENFDFLNSYLGLVGPLVRSNGGFIDKYIGDAIMALYPVSPDDAVKAALDIQKTIYEYNQKRAESNLMQIAIGTGIHTGLLMLGILGEDERVDSTVISDNVNLASRIEGLTKKFGANIIISETTYEGMKVRGLYTFRYLGMIRVKGKKQPVGVYEVLDGCFSEERENKIKASALLAKGIAEFKKGDFRLAGGYFKKGTEKYPSDSAFKVYLDICRECVRNPKTGFDGSLVFLDK
ncbi:MAG TPA: adenylate/guanylate cyclase domain-containing protein [Spirochaetota bacterium]|mgnify:FL=1|nr:adenylate/guanylate cyclase domain-containing protein [Spirochaetota bacterium]